MRTPTPFQPMHSWPQQQERAWKVPRKLRIKLVNKGGGGSYERLFNQKSQANSPFLLPSSLSSHNLLLSRLGIGQMGMPRVSVVWQKNTQFNQ